MNNENLIAEVIEMAEILGKLIRVLVDNGVLSNDDRDFILGKITEAEWITTEDEE